MGAFGDRLKKEREQRGISLDDISGTTKIGTRLLRALEDERFDQLPGGIFNKGFVRAYARHVGIDEEQAVADYMTAVGANQPVTEAEVVPVQVPSEHASQPAPKQPMHAVREAGRPDTTAGVPWGLLAILLLLIALALAGWSYYHREQRVDRNRTTDSGATGALTTPTVPENTPAIPTPSLDQTPSVTAMGTNRAIRPLPSPGSASSTAAQTLQQAATLNSSPAPGGFTVLLKANDESQECWVSITVDGQPPVEATMVAPQQKMIQAHNEVIVKAGSVGAIDLFFNGRKLPPQGEIGVVRTFTFHADGLQVPLSKPQAASQSFPTP